MYVDAQFTNNVLGYAPVTTDFERGGCNGRVGSAAQAAVVMKPEYATTYKFGAKTASAGCRIKANVNIFLIDFKDLQLTAFDANAMFNLLEPSYARISGFETDLSAQITRNWEVGMNLGTLDASYTGFSAASAATFSGKSLKQSPKLQYGLNTGVRLPVDGGAFQFTPQLKHVGAHYQNLATSELIKTQAHRLIDTQLAWEQADGRWSAGV